LEKENCIPPFLSTSRCVIKVRDLALGQKLFHFDVYSASKPGPGFDFLHLSLPVKITQNTEQDAEWPLSWPGQTDEEKTSSSLPACSQTPYSHQRSFSELFKLPLLYTTAT